MNKLKEITQSISRIIMGLLLMGILAAVTQTMLASGLVDWVDNLYRANEFYAFWIAMIISRGAMVAITWALTLWIVGKLLDHGYLWIKSSPELKQKRDNDQDKDKSAQFIGYLLIYGYYLVTAELLIRAFSGVVPIYLT